MRRHTKVLKRGGMNFWFQIFWRIMSAWGEMPMEPVGGRVCCCCCCRYVYVALEVHMSLVVDRHLSISSVEDWTTGVWVIIWTVCGEKVVERRSWFHCCVSCIHKSETEEGIGISVTGKRISCMVAQVSMEGEDQIEEFPAWICKMEFSCKWCLTYKTEDQNTDLGLVAEAVQKEELEKYLAFRTLDRKEFFE